MSKVIEYKGFTACAVYSEEDQCFIGRVNCNADVVGFHAVKEEQLRRVFEEAVDDYLEALSRVENNRPDRCKLIRPV